MTAVLELARRVAPTSATVLLTGESGTGKEVMARCIHMNSPRSQRIFVAVNCAALSPTLIESELFGHEKGAFTGAAAQHLGRFERAHGGTLFLDEIGELDGNLQAKLLRVLQERTFERVGGTREITVDVRVIAATNRQLKRLTVDGKFREDLYYRLNRFPIEIPPLRERLADIEPLAEYFLKRAAKELGKTPPTFSKAAVRILVSYRWPGNVRELENVMERMAILCEGQVDAADLSMLEGEDRPPAALARHRTAGDRRCPAGESRQPYPCRPTTRHQRANAAVSAKRISDGGRSRRRRNGRTVRLQILRALKMRPAWFRRYKAITSM